jgi:hypothetical protein
MRTVRNRLPSKAVVHAIPPEIVVGAGLVLDDAQKLHVAAHYHLPGEQVRLLSGLRFFGESDDTADQRKALFGDAVLVVKELRVDHHQDGEPTINYSFVDVAGVHNVAFFGATEERRHLYGILVAEESLTWFVPFEGDTPGQAIRVSRELSRAARHCFGVHDAVLATFQSHGMHLPFASDDDFFASISVDTPQGSALSGEFVFSRRDEGDAWSLDYAPWMSSTDAVELDKAMTTIKLESDSRVARPAVR